MTPSQTTVAAQAVQNVCNQLKAAYFEAKKLSDYNSVNDPGWSTLSGNYVDANGLVIGTQLLPGDVSNAIGSINEFINYWTGSAVATSAWGQNIEKISNPLE